MINLANLKGIGINPISGNAENTTNNIGQEQIDVESSITAPTRKDIKQQVRQHGHHHTTNKSENGPISVECGSKWRGAATRRQFKERRPVEEHRNK